MPGLKDPAQLEREIRNSGNEAENCEIMRNDLSQHFNIHELRTLNLLELCELFVSLRKQERSK